MSNSTTTPIKDKILSGKVKIIPAEATHQRPSALRNKRKSTGFWRRRHIKS